MREREVREKAQEKRNLKNINKNKIMRLNEP